jgi:hypothetical protein
MPLHVPARGEETPESGTLTEETVFAAGWPCRSAVSTLVIGSSGATESEPGSALLAREEGRWDVVNPWWPRWSEPEFTFFCHPLWPGLLANTAFYGVILWTLWIAPGVIKRTMRKRRGACGQCGYDLRGGGHVVCPECGREGRAVRTVESTRGGLQ